MVCLTAVSLLCPSHCRRLHLESERLVWSQDVPPLTELCPPELREHKLHGQNILHTQHGGVTVHFKLLLKVTSSVQCQSDKINPYPGLMGI